MTDTENPDQEMDVGPWAQEKLACLKKYLGAYTTILRNQRWLKGYFYIDAFAGPGSLKIRQRNAVDAAQFSLLDVSEYSNDDVGEAQYIHGSPRIALELKYPFTDYIFIELDAQRTAQLNALKNELGSQARIFVRPEDCNDYLRKLLSANDGVDWRKWRGVVFLDPFGMQVPWDTIAALGKTKAIEVFINFPVGMAIQRLLKRSGEFSDTERAKLDTYFGTPEWFELLYQRREDLFGDNLIKIDNSGAVLMQWYRDRLQKVFGHVSPARLIRSTSNRPLYYLIHAGPNPTGAKIAAYVLEQGTEV